MKKPILVHWHDSGDPALIDGEKIMVLTPMRLPANRDGVPGKRLKGSYIQFTGSNAMHVIETNKQIAAQLVDANAWAMKLDILEIAYRIERIETDGGKLHYEVQIGDRVHEGEVLQQVLDLQAQPPARVD